MLYSSPSVRRLRRHQDGFIPLTPQGIISWQREEESELHKESFHGSAKKSPNSTRRKRPSVLTLLVRVVSLVVVLRTLTKVLVGYFTVTDLEHLLHGCDDHNGGLILTGGYQEGSHAMGSSVEAQNPPSPKVMLLPRRYIGRQGGCCVLR